MLHKTVCCDPSSEPSRDGSEEGTQDVVSEKYKSNCPSVIIGYHFLSRALDMQNGKTMLTQLRLLQYDLCVILSAQTVRQLRRDNRNNFRIMFLNFP